MLLAVDRTADLEVVIAENSAAVLTGKAFGVELLLLLSLQIRPFDAAIALCAERVIELVVVLLAIWIVVDYIKVGSCEW